MASRWPISRSSPCHYLACAITLFCMYPHKHPEYHFKCRITRLRGEPSGCVEKPNWSAPAYWCGFPRNLSSCGTRTSIFQKTAKAPRSGILRTSFRTPKTLFQHSLQDESFRASPCPNRGCFNLKRIFLFPIHLFYFQNL